MIILDPMLSVKEISWHRTFNTFDWGDLCARTQCAPH
jgi:hypothetical protein